MNACVSNRANHTTDQEFFSCLDRSWFQLLRCQMKLKLMSVRWKLRGATFFCGAKRKRRSFQDQTDKALVLKICRPPASVFHFPSGSINLSPELFSDIHRTLDISLKFSKMVVCENANVWHALDSLRRFLRKFSCQNVWKMSPCENTEGKCRGNSQQASVGDEDVKLEETKMSRPKGWRRPWCAIN